MAIIDLFDRIGNEEGIRKLVDTFYDYMDSLSEAKTVRDLHEPDLTESRDKLYMFLVGWCGGPPLYTEKFGHPRLRMRHMPFSIGEEERDQWMLCMRKALKDCVTDQEVSEFLDARFTQIADFMRNNPG